MEVKYYKVMLNIDVCVEAQTKQQAIAFAISNIGEQWDDYEKDFVVKKVIEVPFKDFW